MYVIIASYFDVSTFLMIKALAVSRRSSLLHTTGTNQQLPQPDLL